MKNMKERWLVYYLILLFTHLMKESWSTKWWNQIYLGHENICEIKNIKRTSAFYPICLKTYKKKLDKHLWWGLFCESCVITQHRLLKWISHFARNLKKVLTEVWKDKKKKSNENRKEIKEHEISNTLHWFMFQLA